MDFLLFLKNINRKHYAYSRKFNKIWNDLESFLKRHKKPVWLVAYSNDYSLSVIKPNKDNIAQGTSAILYDKQDDKIVEIDRIDNFL